MAFAHLPLEVREGVGFVGKDEPGDFLAVGTTVLGERPPIKPKGGRRLYAHSGRYGMFAIQEARRELCGDAIAEGPTEPPA